MDHTSCNRRYKSGTKFNDPFLCIDHSYWPERFPSIQYCSYYTTTHKPEYFTIVLQAPCLPQAPTKPSAKKPPNPFKTQMRTPHNWATRSASKLRQAAQFPNQRKEVLLILLQQQDRHHRQFFPIELMRRRLYARWPPLSLEIPASWVIPSASRQRPRRRTMVRRWRKVGRRDFENL